MASASTPQYRIGTASWTDPTLLKAGFYPPGAKSAEARLRYYAERFDTVEVDSTFYALPNDRNAALWAERTPAEFQFNIKAFASLTRHAADVRALPDMVKDLLSADARSATRLERPSRAVLDCCFELFSYALEPLRRTGKLGCILFQFPPWFTAGEQNEDYIELCRTRMAADRLAIEFRHPSWFSDRTQRTLEFLRDRNLTLVCTDAPASPGIPAVPLVATTKRAYIRFHGRNRQAWFQRHLSAAERFKYCYSDSELDAAASRLRQLQDPKTVYAIFNNCYADYGVRNALTLKRLLADAQPSGTAD